MRNILICTVGTSLAGNLSRLDAQDPMRKAWDEDNLKTVASQIISKKPDERICGAEINSVASICKENGSALIYGSEKKQPKTAIYCRKVSRVA